MPVAVSESMPFPIGAVAANVLGALCLSAGVLGLFVPQLLDALPALKDPTTAWALLGVGIVLDAGSAASILGYLRSRRRPAPEGSSSRKSGIYQARISAPLQCYEVHLTRKAIRLLLRSMETQQDRGAGIKAPGL